MFSWHTEDLDLFAINYVHLGKPKFWYGVPPNEAEAFNKLASSLFPGAYQECPEFLRHKTYLIHPALLKKHNITVHKY
jgi:jumonji domain-containing protein 2